MKKPLVLLVVFMLMASPVLAKHHKKKPKPSPTPTTTTRLSNPHDMPD